jgi:uncharacterized protein YrrD
MTTPNLTCRNLPVYTKLGRPVGRVVDVEIEAASQRVLFYHVATNLRLNNLWHRRLLVSPTQVVEITSQGLIIEDNLMGQPLAEPTNLITQAS